MPAVCHRVAGRAGAAGTGREDTIAVAPRPATGGSGAEMEHSFSGTPFTIGIEEELMLVDARPASSRRGSRRSSPTARTGVGEVKPELMQSVLEIATDPCANLGEAADQLRDLRRRVGRCAAPPRDAAGGRRDPPDRRAARTS